MMRLIINQKGFSRLTDIGDVLFVDSNDEWLSFHGSFYDSVPNTLIDYQSCQTTTVPFDSKALAINVR